MGTKMFDLRGKHFQILTFVIVVLLVVDCKKSSAKSNGARDGQRQQERRKPSIPPKEMIFRWNVELPGNITAKETAKVLNNYERIYIRSRNIPVDSEFSNSSILMYFRKSQLAMKFYEKPKQGSYKERPKEICFLTQIIGTFNETKEEFKTRAKTQGFVELGENAIIMMAEARNRLSVTDLKALSRTVYVFCKRAARDGRAFKLVQKTNQKVSPIPFIGSGMVSPGQKGVSVPYIVEVDKDIKLSLDSEANEGKSRKQGTDSTRKMKTATQDQKEKTKESKNVKGRKPAKSKEAKKSKS